MQCPAAPTMVGAREASDNYVYDSHNINDNNLSMTAIPPKGAFCLYSSLLENHCHQILATTIPTIIIIIRYKYI